MSDRRPSKLYKCEITPTYDEAYDPPEFFGNVISCPEATVDEVLAFVRRGVESGTIEGKRVTIGQNMLGQDVTMPPLANLKSGDYLLIPVSDGGSET